MRHINEANLNATDSNHHRPRIVRARGRVKETHQQRQRQLDEHVVRPRPVNNALRSGHVDVEVKDAAHTAVRANPN
jgi:hypothetical protein